MESLTVIRGLSECVERETELNGLFVNLNDFYYLCSGFNKEVIHNLPKTNNDNERRKYDIRTNIHGD